MKRVLISGIAALLLSATAALANGYPSSGRAIDQLHPASDYSDVVGGRPLALGIMRARANGFVPSEVMQAYANAVLAKLLRGIAFPASFQPQVRVLAAPEFAAVHARRHDHHHHRPARTARQRRRTRLRARP